MFNLLSGMGGGQIAIFAVLLVAIIGLFVWQSISGKKKQKEAQNMVNALKVGDRVKTIGGICGFVVEINNAENTFVLETGTDDKKSYVKFDKGAIYQTAPANGNANPEPKEQPKEEKKPAKKVEKKEEKVEEVKAEETVEQPKEEK
jgi:preprotein translocase subunit YajC